jgi:hypothetical protein
LPFYTAVDILELGGSVPNILGLGGVSRLGRATRDITSDLRGASAPVVLENRAALTEPTKTGALLRAIDDYIRHPAMLIALKLSLPEGHPQRHVGNAIKRAYLCHTPNRQPRCGDIVLFV